MTLWAKVASSFLPIFTYARRSLLGEHMEGEAKYWWAFLEHGTFRTVDICSNHDLNRHLLKAHVPTLIWFSSKLYWKLEDCLYSFGKIKSLYGDEA